MKLHHLVTGGFVVIFVSLILAAIFGDVVVSEGYRDGHLQKFSRKGIVWHTYEGEMALPGMKQVNDKLSNTWEFTVQDTHLAEDVKKLPAGAFVRLHYEQVLFGRPWNGESNYYIKKIEVIKDSNEQSKAN